jgi:predicted RNase H-like HicB family nuclease
MLSAYIAAAMRRATYQLLAADEGFVGEIPGLQGVLGHAETLEACREDLQSALEDWIVFRLRRGLLVPVLEGINLTAPPVIEEAA